MNLELIPNHCEQAGLEITGRDEGRGHRWCPELQHEPLAQVDELIASELGEGTPARLSIRRPDGLGVKPPQGRMHLRVESLGPCGEDEARALALRWRHPGREHAERARGEALRRAQQRGDVQLTAGTSEVCLVEQPRSR